MEFCTQQSLEKLKLLIRGCVEKGPIKLSGGQMSDYKIRLDRATLDSRGQELLAQLIPELLIARHWFPVDAVGGPDRGALPVALAALHGLAAIPVKRDCVVFRIGKGEITLPEGHLVKEGSRVVVMDDVVTRGRSLLKSATACLEAGAEVLGAFAVVDRREGAEELLASHGIQLASLLCASDVL